MKRLRLLLCLAAVLVPSTSHAQRDDLPRPAWQPFEEAVAAAQEHGQKVLVDVYAPWCGWCTKMQQEVYADAGVRTYLHTHFAPTRLNIDAEDETLRFQDQDVSARALARRLGAQGTPTTVFLDENGAYITRLPGYVDAETFLHVLRYVGDDAFKKQTFEDYRNGRE